MTADDLGRLSEDGGALPPHPALTAEPGAADVQITGRLLQASNATFLAELETGDKTIECVYKPLEESGRSGTSRTVLSASGRLPRTRCHGSAVSTVYLSPCWPMDRSAPGPFRFG